MHLLGCLHETSTPGDYPHDRCPSTCREVLLDHWLVGVCMQWCVVMAGIYVLALPGSESAQIGLAQQCLLITVDVLWLPHMSSFVLRYPNDK